MYDLSIPENIKKLIFGKSVAIVGPAGYLQDKGSGHIIDNHEIIIRPNYFSLPKNTHKDYGSRTDIMYHNMASCYLDGLKEQINNNPKDFCNLKAVIGSSIKASNADSNYMQWPDDHISECANNFSLLNTPCSHIDYWWVGVANYKKVYHRVGGEPYTGINAIFITMCCQPSSVYLTGFDFYTGDLLYVDGSLANVDKNQEKRNRGGSHGFHATNKNKQYVKNWYNTHTFVSVDDTLKNILA